MPNLTEQVAKAREMGYPDDAIVKHLQQDKEYGAQVGKAVEMGYAPDAIVSHFIGVKPTQQKAEEPSFMSEVGSTAKSLGKNILGGAVDTLGNIGSTLLSPGDYIADKLLGTKGSNAKRRAAISDVSADVTGGDPNSGGWTTGGLAMGALGAGGVGGALGKGAAALGMPVLANALATGGLSGNAGANILTRIGAGTAVGGTSGALLSGLSNAPAGAALGAVIPGGAALAQGVGRMAANALGGPTQWAANRLENALGGDYSRMSGAVDSVKNWLGKNAKGASPEDAIPMSPATISGDPALLAAERATRNANVANWAPFKDKQNQAVWDSVIAHTKNADELSALQDIRRANWDTNSADVMQSIDPKAWSKARDAFEKYIEAEGRTPSGQNSGTLRPLLQDIKRQMNDLTVAPKASPLVLPRAVAEDLQASGSDFSPAHLAENRGNLSGAIKGSPSSPFATAPRKDPAVLGLRGTIDDVLNGLTGSSWSDKVLGGYARDSVPVSAAKSSKAIQEAFMTPEGVSKKGLMAGSPTVTENALRQALVRFGEHPQFGNTLTEDSRQGLEGTLNVLNQINAVDRLRAASAGGSNTVMDAMLQKVGAGASKVPGARQVAGILNVIGQRADAATAGTVDAALRDPELFVSILQRKLAAKTPLSPLELRVMQSWSGGQASLAHGTE